MVPLRLLGASLLVTLLGVAAAEQFVRGSTARSLLSLTSSSFSPVHGAERELAVSQFGSMSTERLAAASVQENSEFVYVAGETLGALPGHVNVGLKDVVAMKLNSDTGAQVWHAQLGSVGNDAVCWVGLGAGEASVFLAGTTAGSLPHSGSHGADDGFVVKLSAADGSVQHVVQLGTSAHDSLFGATVSHSGAHVYAVGNTGGSLDGFTFRGQRDAVIFKLGAADLTTVWHTQTGTIQRDFWRAVTMGATDNWLYVAGHTQGAMSGANLGSFDMVVARVAAATGTTSWVQQLGTPQADFVFALAFASGRAIVAGSTAGSLPGFAGSGVADAAVVALDAATGAPSWYYQLRRVGSEEQVTSLAVSHGGDYLVASGSTTGALPGQVRAGETDAMLITLHPGNGSVAWFGQVGSQAQDEAGLAATDRRGRVFLPLGTAGALAGAAQAGNGDFALVRVQDAALRTDFAPEVGAELADLYVNFSEPVNVTLPADLFVDGHTAAEDLVRAGVVEVVSGGQAGGQVGIQFVAGAAPGEDRVEGACTLTGDAVLRVTLSARDEAQSWTATSFFIHHTDDRPGEPDAGRTRGVYVALAAAAVVVLSGVGLIMHTRTSVTDRGLVHLGTPGATPDGGEQATPAGMASLAADVAEAAGADEEKVAAASAGGAAEGAGEGAAAEKKEEEEDDSATLGAAFCVGLFA